MIDMNTGKMLVTGFLLLLSGTSSAQDNEADTNQYPSFGGPDSVDARIKEDAKPEGRTHTDALQTWKKWKAELAKDKGISLAIDYSTVSLNADDSPGEDSASSGMLRFYGSWDLAGRGTSAPGALVWKIEHRHAYSDVSPKDLTIGQLGYAGLIVPPFSDQGTRLTNLYWRQRWQGGKVALVAGFLDVTDYVDAVILGSPWLGFLNFNFSTGSATISTPDDATFGAALGLWVTDQFYIHGGIADANSNAAEPFDSVGNFFDEGEYFSHLEFGVSKSKDHYFLNNYHITFWHKDQRTAINEPAGWGAAFSFSRWFDGRWMPFLRGGYSEEGGTLLQKSLGAGLGYKIQRTGDQLGFGLHWGQPNEDTFGPGLKDQKTAELYYRMPVTDEFSLTADVEWLKDPALNTEQDNIWMFNIRARFAL
jgi:porin